MIYKLYPKLIDEYINEDNNYFFEIICSNNHDNFGTGEKFNLEVLDWLIKKVDRKNYNSFLLSGIKSTKTIKFLHRYGANIYFDDDKLFMEACKIKNVNLMYWLHDHGADPRSRDDEAFRTACSLNHTDIALILCHLCDKYNLKVKSGNIIYWKITNEENKPKYIENRVYKKRKLM